MSIFSKERRGLPLPGRRLSTRLPWFSVYLQWSSRTASCAGRRLVLGKGNALSLCQLCLPLAKGSRKKSKMPFGWYRFRQGAHCLAAGPLAVSKINTVVLLRLALVRNAFQREGLSDGRLALFAGTALVCVAFHLVQVCLSGHCFAKGSVFRYCLKAHS